MGFLFFFELGLAHLLLLADFGLHRGHDLAQLVAHSHVENAVYRLRQVVVRLAKQLLLDHLVLQQPVIEHALDKETAQVSFRLGGPGLGSVGARRVAEGLRDLEQFVVGDGGGLAGGAGQLLDEFLEEALHLLQLLLVDGRLPLRGRAKFKFGELVEAVHLNRVGKEALLLRVSEHVHWLLFGQEGPHVHPNSVLLARMQTRCLVKPVWQLAPLLGRVEDDESVLRIGE